MTYVRTKTITELNRTVLPFVYFIFFAYFQFLIYCFVRSFLIYASFCWDRSIRWSMYLLNIYRFLNKTILNLNFVAK